MKTAPYLIIFAMVAWIVLRECGSKPETLPPSIQANKDSITVKNARATEFHDRGEAISRKMAIDSIRNLEALKRQEIKIQGLTRALAAAVRKRPEIRIDTVFILMDSVIQGQAGQITFLKQEKDSLRINYAELLRTKDAEIRVRSEMFDHLTMINQDLYKTVNKEKRKAKFWKVVAPVVFVTGFILGEEL